MLLNDWLTGLVRMDYTAPLFLNVYGDDDDEEEHADDDEDEEGAGGTGSGDEGKGGKSGKKGEEGPKGKNNDPNAGKKTFSQEEVDKLVTKRLAREKQNAREALARLKEVEQTAQMTAKKRDELQSQIADLEKKVLPADEIRKREEKKAREKYENDLRSAQETAKSWESRFNDLKINHEIETAAALAGVKPNSLPLVSAYLKPSTKVVPVLDDDEKETGKFQTQVDFEDQGEDGKPLRVTMTITEVVNRMREQPDKFGNLFEPGSKGGLGKPGGSGKNGGAKDGFRSGMSMEEYMKLRAENPAAVYGRS